MKKILTSILLLAVLVPGVSLAAVVDGGGQYVLPAGQRSLGNTYVGAGNATVTGDVVGDLYLAAGSSVLAGRVSDDLTVAGGTVTVAGEVAGDVRVFGGTVTISGPVYGDIFVMGGSLVINGPVAGDVDFLGGSLTLGNQAQVGGNVTYRTDREAKISPQALVNGQIIYDQDLARNLGLIKSASQNASKGSVAAGLTALFGAWLFLKLLMYFFAGLVAFWLLLPVIKKVTLTTIKQPGRSLGIGILTAIAVPVFILILMISIVGLPVAFLLGFTYLLVALAAKVIAGIVAGVWVDKQIFKRAQLRFTWPVVIVSLLGFFIISEIPVLGWVVAAVITATIFGTMVDLIFARWRELMN